MKKLILTICLLFASFTVYCQKETFSITGMVYDSSMKNFQEPTFHL
ncbi:MAG: hypothetical protein ACOX4D_07340 [Bacteroidales bacterium]